MPDPRSAFDDMANRLIFEPIFAFVDATGRLPARLFDPAMQNKLTGYRMVGKFAVGMAQRAVASRVTPSAPAPSVAPVGPLIAEPSAGGLPDLASMLSSQVITLLDTLDAEQLVEAERVETAGRSRKTVLGRIAQLRSI